MIAMLKEITEGTKFENKANGKFYVYRREGLGRFAGKFLDVDKSPYDGVMMTNEERHAGKWAIPEEWLTYDVPTDSGKKIPIGPIAKKVKIDLTTHAISSKSISELQNIVSSYSCKDGNVNMHVEYPPFMKVFEFKNTIPAFVPKKNEAQAVYAATVTEEFGIRIPDKMLTAMREVCVSNNVGTQAKFDFVRPTSPKIMTGPWFKELIEFRLGLQANNAIVMREYGENDKVINNTWLLPMNGWIVLVSAIAPDALPLHEADVLCSYLGSKYKISQIKIKAEKEIAFSALCVQRISDRGPMDGWIYEIPRVQCPLCKYCDRKYEKELGKNVDGVTLCPDCVKNNTAACVECGNVHLKTNLCTTTRKSFMCVECGKKHKRCSECGIVHYGKNKLCPTCHIKWSKKLRGYILLEDTRNIQLCERKLS